jgi:NTE family protein
MLDLADIPFFSKLPSGGLDRLRQLADVRFHAAGSVICRKGEAGSTFFAIASGGVTVQISPDDDVSKASISLRPGQVFGEMSLLSGMPISATVVAARDTGLYAFSKERFLELLETQPVLNQALVQMLIDRIRHRSSFPSDLRIPPCTLIVLPRGAGSERFSLAVFHAVEHYAPGSFYIDTVSGHGWNIASSDEGRDLLPLSDRPLRKAGASADRTLYAIDENADWVARLIQNWRSCGSVGKMLVVSVGADRIGPLKSCLESIDTVVLHEDPFQDEELTDMSASGFGLARVSRVRIGSRCEASPRQRLGPWFFWVSPDELDPAVQPDSSYRRDRALAPNLDWVARWITGREVGICMSSGAAGGFAHLGVLQVLEEARIPVDYLCGTSMGGAVALLCAKTGSAARSIGISRDLVSRSQNIVDVALLPRAALLAGKKAERIVDSLLGDATFAELGRPVAVVASDLVNGERFVFDRGPAALAVLATTAIPGIFPPVSCEGRLLVDGAVVSRIPLDLLEWRRCGLKIAVNVMTEPGKCADREDLRHRQMKERFERLLGLRHVIASSFELQGWCHGSAETQYADIVLTPRLYNDQVSGYNFGAFNEMIDAGRKATEDNLDFILKSVTSLLKPGVP